MSMDWCPGVSQLKSMVQVISGDTEGALRTQDNFSCTCPGVSQIRSSIELLSGNAAAARQTQLGQLQFLNSVAESIPILGHAKGLAHHAYGDHLGGNRALVASTRTLAVTAGGLGGAVLGPGGIAAGAIGAGCAIDGVFTVVESRASGSWRPYGIVHAVEKVTMEKGVGKSGAMFDAIILPVGDAVLQAVPFPADLPTDLVVTVENKEAGDASLHDSGKIVVAQQDHKVLIDPEQWPPGHLKETHSTA
eukprot:TRINITY_DN16016_c1_g1_i1.p1 TRINITY_DN16016_c1_g1~~TRINITY_DN16016_c1_g1_i1.p1  ORF type:complete len:248 (+),score=31.55 TRINITY_DN16016_c1_g1_i1:52-795(+)